MISEEIDVKIWLTVTPKRYFWEVGFFFGVELKILWGIAYKFVKIPYNCASHEMKVFTEKHVCK